MRLIFTLCVRSAAILLIAATAACSAAHGDANNSGSQSTASKAASGYSTLTFRTRVPAGYHPIAAAQIPHDAYYDGWAGIIEHGDGVAAAYGIPGGNPILALTPKGKTESANWHCLQAAWGGPESGITCDQIPNSLLGRDR